MTTSLRRSGSEWVAECQYIERVTAQKGKVPEMNRDLSTFIRYCYMQKGIATREGRFDTETYIQHCIDDLEAA